MSTYEDYEKVAPAYAKWRKPIGSGVITGYFGQLVGVGARLLDIGCGAGHYTHVLSTSGFKAVGVDRSLRQLELAQGLYEDGPQTGEVLTGDALDLPFEDRAFDGALLNMVLHHLDIPGNGFVNARAAIKEASRVLRYGGVLIIGTVSSEQARHGAWYYSLSPEISERFGQRFMPESELESCLDQLELHLFEKVVPLVQVFRPETYFRSSGILDPEWRSSTSVFSLLSDDETKTLVRKAEQLQSRGILEDVVKEHESVRQRYGQITFYVLAKGDRDR